MFINKNTIFAFFILSSFVFSYTFLPFDPKYILLLLWMALFSAIFFLNIKRKIPWYIFISVIFSFFLLVLQVISYKIRIKYHISTGFDSSLLSSILFVTGCLAFPISYMIMRNNLKNKSDYLNFIRGLVNIVNVYFILELIIRLINYDNMEHSFYVFKNSAFYLDSNFVGLILVSYYIFLVFLKNKKILNIKYSIYLVVFLIAMTFSRSAWLVIIYLLVFFKVDNKGNIKALKFYTPIISLIFAFFSVYASYIINPDFIMSIDPSLNTKFLFLERAIDHVSQYEYANIFGLGLASSSIIYGRYFHNILAIFVFEMGIAFVIIFLLYLVTLAKLDKNYIPVLIISNLMMGMSLFSTNISYLFFFISLMVFLNKNYLPIKCLDNIN